MPAINSIQRGVITIPSSGISNTSAAVTISSVDVSKSSLRLLGGSCNSSGNVTSYPRIVLTNSTTITATRVETAINNALISWELTEYV